MPLRPEPSGFFAHYRGAAFHTGIDVFHLRDRTNVIIEIVTTRVPR